VLVVRTAELFCVSTAYTWTVLC